MPRSYYALAYGCIILWLLAIGVARADTGSQERPPPNFMTILRTGETIQIWQPCNAEGMLIETDPRGTVILAIRLLPAKCREE